MTTTQPRRGDMRCPVCLTVTSTVTALNQHASGRADGYRCARHGRTLAEREIETARALLGYDPSGLARGE
jgi:hypothetical protein